jgi:G:T/U-mismatch repair DNA glycosylase
LAEDGLPGFFPKGRFHEKINIPLSLLDAEAEGGAAIIVRSFDPIVDARTKVLILGTDPAVERVYFNGSTAESVFRRLVHVKMRIREGLGFHRLPSTSPANAMPFEAKMAEWKKIVTHI